MRRELGCLIQGTMMRSGTGHGEYCLNQQSLPAQEVLRLTTDQLSSGGSLISGEDNFSLRYSPYQRETEKVIFSFYFKTRSKDNLADFSIPLAQESL